jgi:glycosyltransferase involved in cell wall biosynthesis
MEPNRLRRARRLARVLRRENVDICLSLLSPFVAAAAGRVARVAVAHWLQNPTFTIPGIANDGIRGRGARLAVATYSRCAAFVAAASPGLVSEWRAHGADIRKIGLLPNPIRVDAIPLPRTNGDHGYEVVTVGRLVPQKRHDLLIRAVAHLGDIPARLTIVGRGPMEAELRSLALALGIAHRVRFAGFCRQPWDLLAAADVFALASDFEGFGNVIVEALAAGLPVVATDAPYGPRFILRDGQFGRLVQPGDAVALAQGIRETLQKRGLDPSVQRAWAESFATAKVAERLDALAARALRREPMDPNMRRWP